MIEGSSPPPTEGAHSRLGALKSFLKRRLGPQKFEIFSHAYFALRNLPTPAIAWKLRREHTGSGTYIDPSAHFLGWNSIRIAENCIISADCWFNVNQRGRDREIIVIGKYSHIGRRNTFNAGARIVIGEYGLTGSDCSFMGSNHVYSNPRSPYIATGTTIQDEIILGVNCWLGIGVTILGNVEIGHGCIVGAKSLVTKDAPPFSILVGSPARVIKRYDFLTDSWVEASQFTAEQESALPDADTYLAMLRDRAPFIRMPKAAAGASRGDLP